MCKITTSFASVIILFICLLHSPSLAQTDDKALVTISSQDPAVTSVLGNEDSLYVMVQYESEIPLRFQAIGMREGLPLEVGAIRNPAALHAPGRGEALVWVSYTNPTRLDAVAVIVMDEKWEKLYSLSKATDMKWQGFSTEQPRVPAKWVDTLKRAEERKIDYFYDPSPKKYGLLTDVMFFLSMICIPAYILLQLHMLWRYQYRWRELAMIPIFPYLILAFYMIVGLEIDESFRVVFLFRYTSLAFLYLVALWLAKRFWQDKLGPPKLYKPPKD
jgi:hypothetical protein